ncbi:MAG: hypothetical protein RSB91_03555 [Clostridia bacterium]
MHIEKYQSNGKEYLRLAKTNCVKNQQGKSVNLDLKAAAKVF